MAAGKTSLLLTLAGLLRSAAGRARIEGGGAQEFTLLAQDLLLPYRSAERNAAAARRWSPSFVTRGLSAPTGCRSAWRRRRKFNRASMGPIDVPGFEVPEA